MAWLEAHDLMISDRLKETALSTHHHLPPWRGIQLGLLFLLCCRSITRFRQGFLLSPLVGFATMIMMAGFLAGELHEDTGFIKYTEASAEERARKRAEFMGC